MGVVLRVSATPSPKSRFHRILWDSHAVVGAITGIALFVMFYAGAFALYRGELHAWSDPALRAIGAEPSLAPIDALFREAPPDRGTHAMIVHPLGDRPYFFVRYQRDGERVERWIGAVTGVAMSRDGRSAIPDLLHDLHYFRQLGTFGRTVSGIVSLLLVFVLVSGLLIHWRKLPRALHELRVNRGIRIAVTDAHTTLGVLGLPFTLMYAVTGAFFGLLLLLLGPTVLVVFDGDPEALEAHVSGVRVPETEPSGRVAPALMPSEIERRVLERWGHDVELFRTDVTAWGDDSSLVVVEGARRRTLMTSGKLVMSSTTGAIRAEVAPEDANVLGRTIAVMTNLHFARLGSVLFDPLFFVLALFSCAVLLSGNVLWLFGRSSPGLDAGARHDRWLGRGTIGVCVGLTLMAPLALGLSRLLPLEWDAKPLVEARFFYAGWLLSSALAFWVRDPLAYARRLVEVASVASFGAAGMDIALGVRGAGFDHATLAVDTGLLAAGTLLLLLRWKLFTRARFSSSPRGTEP